MNFSRPSVGFYSSVNFSPFIAIENGFKFMNIDDALKSVVRLVFVNFENFPTLKFDSTMFEKNNIIAIELLNREISIRRKKILELFVTNVDEWNNKICSISDSEIDIIFANIDKLDAIKRIINDAINPMLLLDDYALCGKKLFLDLPGSYIITNDNEDPEELLKQAIRRRELLQRIKKEQETISIQRRDFRWKVNPFLVSLRQIYKDEIAEMVSRYRFVFSEFDLGIQLLMHLGAYKINEVWNISDNLMLELSQLNEIEKICAKFKQMLDDGRVSPNDLLVREELSRLAGELKKYFLELHTDVGGECVMLPSLKMCDIRHSPFADSDVRTELVMKNKEFINSPDGRNMIVYEKLSGKRVIFSPIPSEISSLYSRGFCNLHYANSGEIAAYGAFIEGEDLPFAYSSYGKVSYGYTKEMLLYFGFADSGIIESSRAWNAAWAPENTMSVLFSYSQEQLKEKFGNRICGILTSINPNLGFSASAFRGVHFEIASLKPTIFSYQLVNKKPYFHSKNEIAKRLGVDVLELSTSQYYTDNKIPFLPTVEFLYLYEQEKRKRLLESPIYVVSKNDYLSNR